MSERLSHSVRSVLRDYELSCSPQPVHKESITVSIKNDGRCSAMFGKPSVKDVRSTGFSSGYPFLRQFLLL